MSGSSSTIPTILFLEVVTTAPYKKYFYSAPWYKVLSSHCYDGRGNEGIRGLISFSLPNTTPPIHDVKVLVFTKIAR